MKYLVPLLIIASFLISCSLTGASSSAEAESVDISDYSYDLAVELYEMGTQNIEDSDWISAELNLEKAIEVLAEINPKSENEVNDSLDVRNRELFEDILELLEEVYQKSHDLIEVDSEFVFPELEATEEEESRFLGIEAFVRDSIDFSVFDMPIVINDRVIKELKYLTQGVPGFMEGSLGRMSHFKEMIHRKLAENKMPKDIIFQSLIESGFKVKAYSSASASGIWQFISATGKRYGLKSDYWYDQRRNPELATDAAIKYLQRLYDEFQDWYLAFAAYNCGENRIRRLVRKYETKDYWALRLPRETMKYVPRIIAAAIIGHYPEKFNMNVVPEPPTPATEDVVIKHCISLDVAAKMVGVSDSLMRVMNPEIRKWCTPPNVRSFTLRVPEGKKDAFESAYAKMDKSKLVKWVRHQVSWGENLGLIAKKYGVSVAALKSANNIRGSKIWARQMLVIPLSSHKYDTYANQSENESKKERRSVAKTPSGSYETYKVRRGDNLYTISKKLGVTIKELLRWNRLSLKSVLNVGQRLKIYKAIESDKTVLTSKGDYLIHTVNSGESLYLISKKYGVALADLKKINNMRSSRIYPGQELRVERVAVKSEKPDEPKYVKESSKSRISHKVRGGESIYKIARRYDVTIQDIKGWNKMEGSRIYPGQDLVIFTEKDFNGSDVDFHVVRSGDSLWSISQKYGVSIRKLKILNSIGSRIVPGMKLKIR